MNDPFSLPCPACLQATGVITAGFNSPRRQHSRCPAGAHYCLTRTSELYPNLRVYARQLSLTGMRLRAIGRRSPGISRPSPTESPPLPRCPPWSRLPSPEQTSRSIRCSLSSGQHSASTSSRVRPHDPRDGRPSGISAVRLGQQAGHYESVTVRGQLLLRRGRSVVGGTRASG